MNVLISSAGRRVELVQLFQEAQGRAHRVFVCDSDTSASAACVYAGEGASFEVPPVSDYTAFKEAVIEQINHLDIKLVIPTIDPELSVWSRIKEEEEAFLRECNVHILVSSYGTLQLCYDKLMMQQFLREALVEQFRTPREIMHYGTNEWCFAKPRLGSGSAGVLRIVAKKAVQTLVAMGYSVRDYVLQEYVQGAEFTFYCYTDRFGELLDFRGHERLATRGGEVSKASTLSESELREYHPGARELNWLFNFYGPWCYQIIQVPGGSKYLIDINPRFGGGYPIHHKAGAHFVERCLNEAADEAVHYKGRYEKLVALRYDNALYY